MSYDKMPLRSLLDIQLRLNKAITDAKQREKAKALAEMQKLLQARGFNSFQEVFGAKVAGHKKRTGKHQYINPDNPEQRWTGYGRKPNWLAEKISKGAKLEEFRA